MSTMLPQIISLSTFSRVLALLTAVLAASTPVSSRAVLVGKSQSTSALVDLGYSQYQGTSLPGGVNQYLGMRFAAIPTGICSTSKDTNYSLTRSIGELRWRAPVDPPRTNGTQDATAVGRTSVQHHLLTQNSGEISASDRERHTMPAQHQKTVFISMSSLRKPQRQHQSFPCGCSFKVVATKQTRIKTTMERRSSCSQITAS